MSKKQIYRFFGVSCFFFAFTVMASGQGVYEAWVARYDGPGNGGDEARALAVDDSGNVYVSGGSYGGGSLGDYATIKYAPDGDTLWVRRYNGPANLGDYAYALAVDTSGNVYVTGTSGNSFSGIYDYATIKYGPNGDTLWVRRYSLAEASALAVDANGNVYVTGSSYSGTSSDYATIKYAPNGDTLWVKRYNGPDSFDDQASALVLDSTGNVYATGSSFGLGTDYDYATIKYSPCAAIPGDVNGTSPIDLPDIIHLVNFVFDKDRPATSCLGADPGYCWEPSPLCQGEVNGTPPIGLPDIIHLVNFVFDKDKPADSCLGTDPGSCWTPVATEACCLPVP